LLQTIAGAFLKKALFWALEFANGFWNFFDEFCGVFDFGFNWSDVSCFVSLL
jgi:hypothetical protein